MMPTTLGDILTVEDQNDAKVLANAIGATMGEAKKSVIINALAIAIATAELVDFVEPHGRDAVLEFIQHLTADAAKMMAERKPEPVLETESIH
jgi:hypothetical protein